MRHAYQVTYSRSWRWPFRRLYWLRCYACDLREGPFTTHFEAVKAMDGSTCPGIG